MFDLIVAAAGRGQRCGPGKSKLLRPLYGRTVLEWSVFPFLSEEGLERILVAVPPGDAETARVAERISDKVILLDGGATRFETVRNALAGVLADRVLIHDGARPFVSSRVIGDVLRALDGHGAAVPAVPLTDSVVEISNGCRPLDRSLLRAVQTPQGFHSGKIKAAYAAADGLDHTDDASVYLSLYQDLILTEGSPLNRKITRPDDLLVPDCRTGTGWDAHRLERGRRLILGGVRVPSEKGLAGHSDADVLAHAIADALLSAAGERDIGFHFPDTDDRYLDADSMTLLKETLEIVRKRGFVPENVAAEIICERPRLSPHIPAMAENLAGVLGLDAGRVGISATTAEGTGAEGRGEVVSVSACATVSKRKTDLSARF